MNEKMEELLTHYANDHRHIWNQRIHKIAVPAILVSSVGIFTGLGKFVLPEIRLLSGGNLQILFMLIWYGILDRRLPRVMAPLLFGAAALVTYLDRHNSELLWPLSMGVFVIAWIFQFIGHRIEGNRPALFSGLKYLLVGPMWVMITLRRRFGDDSI
ncbi:MAG: Mpo1-like protein [Pseudomonadota bacterium]